MHIQLTTGNDSFRAQNRSMRRNVTMSAFVIVPSLREVKPLFAAYKAKLPGFRHQNVIHSIPASDVFISNVNVGMWYVTRYEMPQGTQILLDYLHSTGNGFGDHEYQIIIADESAPLWNITTQLPTHHLASVPEIHQEGRFHLVREDDQLGDHVNTWRNWFALDEEYKVSDLMDINMGEDHVFGRVRVEGGKKKTSKIVKKDGKIRVKRTRKIAI